MRGSQERLGERSGAGERNMRRGISNKPNFASAGRSKGGPGGELIRTVSGKAEGRNGMSSKQKKSKYSPRGIVGKGVVRQPLHLLTRLRNQEGEGRQG